MYILSHDYIFYIMSEQSEKKIQAESFQWLWNNHPHTRGFFFHVPNGGSRNKIEAMQLKASGVVPGIPDCLFISPINQKTYGFEFKTEKGLTSFNQQKIHHKWQNAGIEVFIIRSVEQFKETITQLLPDSV